MKLGALNGFGLLSKPHTGRTQLHTASADFRKPPIHNQNKIQITYEMSLSESFHGFRNHGQPNMLVPNPQIRKAHLYLPTALSIMVSDMYIDHMVSSAWCKGSQVLFGLVDMVLLKRIKYSWYTAEAMTLGNTVVWLWMPNMYKYVV